MLAALPSNFDKNVTFPGGMRECRHSARPMHTPARSSVCPGSVASNSLTYPSTLTRRALSSGRGHFFFEMHLDIWFTMTAPRRRSFSASYRNKDLPTRPSRAYVNYVVPWPQRLGTLKSDIRFTATLLERTCKRMNRVSGPSS